MCGIAGIIDLRHDPQARDTMARITGFLHHRGPDAAGIYANGPAVLGHTRLSIIDLSGGDQPIHNENKVRMAFTRFLPDAMPSFQSKDLKLQLLDAEVEETIAWQRPLEEWVSYARFCWIPLGFDCGPMCRSALI
jgi:glutamate synthase domain-containing protein 1